MGSLNSGKSALVHRYLTGSYMQEESPEGSFYNLLRTRHNVKSLDNRRIQSDYLGGRFKKEFVSEDQSYLLLIRDEGGHPEQQVSTLL